MPALDAASKSQSLCKDIRNKKGKKVGLRRQPNASPSRRCFEVPASNRSLFASQVYPSAKAKRRGPKWHSTGHGGRRDMYPKVSTNSMRLELSRVRLETPPPTTVTVAGVQMSRLPSEIAYQSTCQPKCLSRRQARAATIRCAPGASAWHLLSSCKQLLIAPNTEVGPLG